MTHNSELAERLVIKEEEQQQRSEAEAACNRPDQFVSDVTDRLPPAASLRMILLLSIGSWVLIGAVIAWLLS